MEQKYGHALDRSSTFFNEVGSDMTVIQEGVIRQAVARRLSLPDAG